MTLIVAAVILVILFFVGISGALVVHGGITGYESLVTRTGVTWAIPLVEAALVTGLVLLIVTVVLGGRWSRDLKPIVTAGFTAIALIVCYPVALVVVGPGDSGMVIVQDHLGDPGDPGMAVVLEGKMPSHLDYQAPTTLSGAGPITGIANHFFGVIPMFVLIGSLAATAIFVISAAVAAVSASDRWVAKRRSAN